MNNPYFPPSPIIAPLPVLVAAIMLGGVVSAVCIPFALAELAIKRLQR